jgi:hypothetical protein
MCTVYGIHDSDRLYIIKFINIDNTYNTLRCIGDKSTVHGSDLFLIVDTVYHNDINVNIVNCNSNITCNTFIYFSLFEICSYLY